MRETFTCASSSKLSSCHQWRASYALNLWKYLKYQTKFHVRNTMIVLCSDSILRKWREIKLRSVSLKGSYVPILAEL